MSDHLVDVVSSATTPPKLQNKTEYTYAQALAASTAYFNGDALAASVFIDKYALRGKNGNILEATPDAMHDRLANEFARVDSEKYGLEFAERFNIYRQAMQKFAHIVPQGSPMSAIGANKPISASNCVVVAPPEDSVEGIIDTGKQLAQLMKRRCGVGVDLSSLRPEGFKVNNSAGTTSGAWSFADFYSYITRMIGQNNRRGALMLTLDVHHPDVIKFAVMKHDLTKVTGSNISVKLSDEFLKAVENNTTYEQRWPIANPVFKRQVSAKEVWDTIVDSATKTAEPGIIFWDRTTQYLPAHSYTAFKSSSCNPCSEISLSNFDSCRLISINLTGYVKNAFSKDAKFDWESFKNDVKTAVQMGDNLVDLEIELIDKIIEVSDSETEKELWRKLQKSGVDGRRVGLGTHGLADLLAQLKIKYDSEESIRFIDELYKTFRDTAYSTSIELAKIRGPFPVWDWNVEKDNLFIKSLPSDMQDNIAKYGRRNIAQLTQAPTGSVSIVSKCGEFNRFNVSSGVEPVFRNSYTRRRKINPNQENTRVDFVDNLGDKWQEYEVFHSNVENFFEFSGKKQQKLPEFFVASDQIDWEFRVKLQSTEQKYIDHSISSTANFPKGTSSELIGKVYLEAWRAGCKGFTVYVDGSRSGVLITKEDKIDPNTRPTKIVRMMAPKRPISLPCDIHTTMFEGKRWAALVGLLANEPYELFLGHSDKIDLPSKQKIGRIEKTDRGKYVLKIGEGEDELIVRDIIGTFNNTKSAWASRLISTSLRHGVPIPFLCEQLSKDGQYNDLNRIIARILKKYIQDGTKNLSSETCSGALSDGKICGSTNLVYEEGCKRCLDCGSSKCG